MSLLMDALKKAEMAKRQGAAGDEFSPVEPGGISSLSLEPVAPAQKSPAPDFSALSASLEENRAENHHEPQLTLKDTGRHTTHYESGTAPSASSQPEHRSMELQPTPTSNRSTVTEPDVSPPARSEPLLRIDDQKEVAGAHPSRSEVQGEADRKNAKNLFQAKQPAANPASKKTFAIAVGVTSLLSCAAIGGYFWWQLQPKSGLMPGKPVNMPLAALPSPPLKPEVAPAQQQTVAPTTAAAPEPIEIPPAATPTKSPVVAKNPLPPTEDEEDSPVRVTKSPLKVNPNLARGFEAAARGDNQTAQTAYSAVLGSDPQNVDALHGMATLALRAGRMSDAERYLQQILVANPQDTVALSGLTNLYARNNPAQAESRLKALANAQPEQAAPHIALGNIYLAQNRWNEAQQAYFAAYATQPDNPDVMFNLAISLEYLNQPRLAQQYYREALEASKRRPAGFNAAQVEERLRALQP